MNRNPSQSDTYICGDIGFLAIDRQTEAETIRIRLGNMCPVSIVTKKYEFDLQKHFESGPIPHFLRSVSAPLPLRPIQPRVENTLSSQSR